jgi:hypothetical protein
LKRVGGNLGFFEMSCLYDVASIKGEAGIGDVFRLGQSIAGYAILCKGELAGGRVGCFLSPVQGGVDPFSQSGMGGAACAVWPVFWLELFNDDALCLCSA